MKLYIHFGFYKAGSSFIQYICASQRQDLIDQGIYFPESKHDQKMSSGFISPGNADFLEEALLEKSFQRVDNIFKNWFKKASDKKANSVLISAEGLVFFLAHKPTLDKLIKSITNAGFITISAMGFFRDLADHALSTYKHRAKNGNLNDYQKWINETYEAPYVINSLSDTISKTSEIKWLLRKFKKDSNYLLVVFFKQWLSIDVPKFSNLRKVNESVTLSEIMVLNHLKKVYPNVLDFFVDDFKGLAKSDKADDFDFQFTFFNLFVEELHKFNFILHKINNHFFENDKIVIGETIKSDESRNILLSDVQLKILGKRIKYFNSYKGIRVRLRRYIIGAYRKNSQSINTKRLKFGEDYLKNKII